MTKKIKILKKLDERSLNLIKHIGFSSIFKAGSILIGILLVPLSIKYLGNDQYGLWLTIFSFLGWFNIVDFGIGNGLRNKLSETFVENNLVLAKKYISTAYFSMFVISSFTLLFFLMLFPYIPWDIVFKFDPNDKHIKLLILVSFIMFSVNLTLKNITALLYADQRSSIPELMSFIGQAIMLLAVYMTMMDSKKSLLIYGIIILGAPILVFLVSTLTVFIGKYKSIRPNITYVKKKYAKNILKIGGKFFIIQISAILLYTTDNFIINQVLGSSEVTVYNIPYKYFMLAITLMSIIATPYWSAFTKAYSQNDDVWLKKSMRMLKIIGLIITSILAGMIFFAEQVYDLWVGELVFIPPLLTLIMGLNTMIRVYLNPFVMFLNGTGKIKIELYLGMILAFINIPLSIFLAKNMDLGVTGVILATLLVGLVELIIFPIQVRKILNKNARGIWNA